MLEGRDVIGLEPKMWEGLGRILHEAFGRLQGDERMVNQAEMLAKSFQAAIADKVGLWPISREERLYGPALLFAGLHVLDSLREVAGYPRPEHVVDEDLYPPVE